MKNEQESILINPTPKIVILTGAGISAESGIKTFRDQNGLWENHDVLSVASPQGFERDPELVHNFYNQRRRQLLSEFVAPNPAHFSLAELESQLAGEVIVVTQNIDNLHERAGSQNVLHMHGELTKMRCQSCQKVFPCTTDITSDQACESCLEKSTLRPHVVWFGEVPLEMIAIEEHLLSATHFVSIGTSGQVYPAAMFIEIARQNPACQTFEINLEQTQGSPFFHEHIYGKASEVVPLWVEKTLKSLPKNSQS